MEHERVLAAASTVKAKMTADEGKMTVDVAAVVHRDRVFLDAVCKEVGLEPNAENRTFVYAILAAAGVATHEEYPKMIYSNGPKRPGVTVANKDEEALVMKSKPQQEGTNHPTAEERTAAAGVQVHDAFPGKSVSGSKSPQPAQKQQKPIS